MAPRDGSNVYHRPPGTDAVPDTTIESTKYNTNVADVEQDLNTPRPIVAGGTGAANARDAMTSLQGDVAYQVVTNYDAYPFISGSFYSAAGATSAPTGNAFIGTCYTADPAVVPPAVPASANLFIEARDVTTGIKYLRQKTAGVWAAWKAMGTGSTADLDAAYVNVTGDTMTGSLTINQGAINSTLILNATNAGASDVIRGQRNGVDRWVVVPGNATAESGGNVGTDFQIAPCNDAGTILAAAFSIIRGTGAATFTGTLTVGTNAIVTGTVTAGFGGVTGSYYFGNSGTKSLSYDGTNYTLTGGGFTVGGSTTVNGNGTINGQLTVSHATVATAIQAANTIADTATANFGFASVQANANGGTYSFSGFRSTVRASIAGMATANHTGNATYQIAGIYGWVPTGGHGSAAIAGMFDRPDGAGHAAAHAYSVGMGGGFNSGLPSYAFSIFDWVTGYTFTIDGNGTHGAHTISDTGGSTNTFNGSACALGVNFIGGGSGFGFVTKPRTAGTSTVMFFANSAGTGVGTINITDTTTFYNTSSDASLKEDLKSFDAGNIVDETEVYNFKWKSSGERAYGVIAQQAVAVYPTAVTHTEKNEAGDEFWGVDYSKYVPVLLQELKALRARVRDLEGRVGVGVQPA